MVARAHNYSSPAFRRIDNPDTGFSSCAIYLCNLLITNARNTKNKNQKKEEENPFTSKTPQD